MTSPVSLSSSPLFQTPSKRPNYPHTHSQLTLPHRRESTPTASSSSASSTKYSTPTRYPPPPTCHSTRTSKTRHTILQDHTYRSRPQWGHTQYEEFRKAKDCGKKLLLKSPSDENSPNVGNQKRQRAFEASTPRHYKQQITGLRKESVQVARQLDVQSSTAFPSQENDAECEFGSQPPYPGAQSNADEDICSSQMESLTFAKAYPSDSSANPSLTAEPAFAHLKLSEDFTTKISFQHRMDLGASGILDIKITRFGSVSLGREVFYRVFGATVLNTDLRQLGRDHCNIRVEADETTQEHFVIVENRSNPILVNDKEELKAGQKKRLRHGDVITLDPPFNGRTTDGVLKYTLLINEEEQREAFRHHQFNYGSLPTAAGNYSDPSRRTTHSGLSSSSASRVNIAAPVETNSSGELTSIFYEIGRRHAAMTEARPVVRNKIALFCSSPLARMCEDGSRETLKEVPHDDECKLIKASLLGGYKLKLSRSLNRNPNAMSDGIDVNVAFATKDSLQQVLADGYQMVHYIGQCSSAGLIIENAFGGAEQLENNELLSLMISSKVKVVVATSTHPKHAANAFMTAGVPHIVAIQSCASHDVVDDSANAFLQSFYTSMGEGISIQEAFSHAISFVQTSCRFNSPSQLRGKFLLYPEDGDHSEVVFHHQTSSGTVVPKDDAKKMEFSSLPPQLPNFVERTGEVFELCRVLSTRASERKAVPNVVALCGDPGVGKSSVAISAANYLSRRRRYKGGVSYISIRKIVNTNLVTHLHSSLLHLTALTLSEQLAERILNQISRILYTQLYTIHQDCNEDSVHDTLLLLDDCDYLLDTQVLLRSLHRILADLANKYPHLTILLTGRTRPFEVLAPTSIQTRTISIAPLNPAATRRLLGALVQRPISRTEVLGPHARGAMPEKDLTFDECLEKHPALLKLRGNPGLISLFAEKLNTTTLDQLI